VRRSSATYEHLTVLPYTRLLGKPDCSPHEMEGGPAFPDFERLTWQRHNRVGEPADSLPSPVPPATARLAGHWVWCGPVVLDFSHQFAEFMHRLPVLPEQRADGLLFAATPWDGGRVVDELPRYVESALGALGLDDAPVHLVAEPTEVERVTVLEAGTQFRAPSEDWYLEELLLARPWPTGQPAGSVLFLSRAGLDRGRPLGEGYLERLIADAGGRVMRPERASVAEVLDAVESVQHLVITDGGAAHQLELLGRLPDLVTMIARRSEDSARYITEEPLARRAGRRFELIDANDGYVCLRESADAGWDPHGMALLSLPRALDALGRSGLPVSRGDVDPAEWAVEVRADLEAHLTSSYAERLARRPDHGAHADEVRAAVEAWIASWGTAA